MSTVVVTFAEKLDKFVADCQELINQHYQTNFPSLETPTLEIAGGKKFKRLTTKGSAYCFVATCDGSTKALGTYKAGDIFKPASWKAPAKHARGNIFDENDGMKNMSSYGPAYLN